MKKLIVLTVCFLLIAATSFADKRYLKTGSLIAASESILNKAASMLAVNDMQALNHMLVSGTIAITDKRVQVYIIDFKMFAGKVHFRVAGTDIELWSFAENVLK